MAFSTLPQITGFTEPLPLDKSGDPEAFNASIQRWITELNAYAISLNGDWRTNWNASAGDVNTIVTNTPAISTCAANVPAIIDVNANEDNINAVHTNMESVTRCASNIGAIVDAKNQADKAATQAGIATKAADRAVAVAGVDVATDEKAGLARGDWDTITTNSGVLTAPAPIVVPWALTAAVAVDDLVPVPRAYIVGAHEFVLYKNGMALAESDYEEVGPVGELSTLIKAKFTAVSGDKLMLYGPFALRPMLVIDPSQGVVDPRLVCTRAGATYVTGQDGKIAEVAANVVPIDWSTGKGRIACFGQRTRLNWYYKSAQGIYCMRSRGASFSVVQDDTAPVGSYYDCFVNPETATDDQKGYVQFFDLLQDTYAVGVGSESEYVATLSFVYETDSQDLSVRVIGNNGGFLNSSKTLEKTNGLKNSYSVTMTVPSGEKIRSLRIYNKNISNTIPWEIKIYWYQIEASPFATPLIAGPEGQQVTVPGQTIRMPFYGKAFDAATLYTDAECLGRTASQALISSLSGLVSCYLDAAYWTDLLNSHSALKTLSGETYGIQSTKYGNKICTSFSPNTYALASDDLFRSQNGDFSSGITVTNLYLSSASYPLNGYVSKIIVWDRALPDAQLKALTAE